MTATTYLSELTGKEIRIRSYLSKALAECEPAGVISLAGVDFMSRSAADELLEFATHYGITLKDAGKGVAEMLEAVGQTRTNGRKTESGGGFVKKADTLKDIISFFEDL